MKTYAIGPKCTQCEACVSVCPTKSIFFGREHFVIDADTCGGCAICVAVCPVDVITVLRTDEPPPQNEGSPSSGTTAKNKPAPSK